MEGRSGSETVHLEGVYEKAHGITPVPAVKSTRDLTLLDICIRVLAARRFNQSGTKWNGGRPC